MVITAITYLIGGKSFLHDLVKMHDDRSFVFLSGWILLILGLVTVLMHNVWTPDWQIIITLAGWASLLKGVTRISFPEATQRLIAIAFKNKIDLFRIALVFVGLLGIWLLLAS